MLPALETAARETDYRVPQAPLRVRCNFDVVPAPLYYAKLVLIVVVIMAFAYLLAQYRGLPIVGLILFLLIGVSTASSRSEPSSVATSTRSAATSTPPPCPVSAPSASTS